jgi:colicin import membrane protein
LENQLRTERTERAALESQLHTAASAAAVWEQRATAAHTELAALEQQHQQHAAQSALAAQTAAAAASAAATTINELEARVAQIAAQLQTATRRAEDAETERDRAVKEAAHAVSASANHNNTADIDGRVEHLQQQLEQQRAAFEAELDRRHTAAAAASAAATAAAAAAASKQHALEAELDSLRANLGAWAADKQAIAALQRQLDEDARAAAAQVSTSFGARKHMVSSWSHVSAHQVSNHHSLLSRNNQHVQVF